MLATLRANIAATLLGLLAAILLVVSVVQTVRLDGLFWIEGANDKLERVTRDNNELRAELKAISDRKNEQAERTKGNIEQAERIGRDADRVAERIEQAPLTGDCRTSDEVMRAGI